MVCYDTSNDQVIFNGSTCESRQRMLEPINALATFIYFLYTINSIIGRKQVYWGGETILGNVFSALYYLIHSWFSVDLNKGIDRYSIISSDLKCGQLSISDHSVCSCTADLCSFTELS